MYASGLSSHRIRIKKIKAKKAHLGCLQRKRFQRPLLLFCSHLMPDSIANHIRFTFKTSPKSSHCPPPLHNQSCLDWVLTRITATAACAPGFHLCVLVGDYSVRTISSECTPGPIAVLKTLRDFLSRSDSKPQSSRQAHDLASWRGGWSHPLIHSSCSVLLTMASMLPFSPHGPCTSHSLLGTFFLQIFTRCLSSLLVSLLKSHLIREVFPDPMNQGPDLLLFRPVLLNWALHWPSRDIWQCLNVVTTGVCECACVYLCVCVCAIYIWVKAREAIKPPTVHSVVSKVKNDLDQNVTSVENDKPLLCFPPEKFTSCWYIIYLFTISLFPLEYECLGFCSLSEEGVAHSRCSTNVWRINACCVQISSLPFWFISGCGWGMQQQDIQVRLQDESEHLLFHQM